jgi:phytanoyl-CoA hydroxylase
MSQVKMVGAARDGWARAGFFKVEGFADRSTCDSMLARARQIVRSGPSDRPAGSLVLAESNKAKAETDDPTDKVSKIFSLHRDPVFRDFALLPHVTALVADIIGGDLDVFLSQFIFKTPGAWGQPWHQDSYYFPFTPSRPVVGIWLAITEATIDNGCLHVLPGSQAEPIHEHIPDRRPGANYGYVEIVDHNMTGSEPVLMQPGDLLVFDSHLMHRSTDNVSQGIRAAMVYHYAAAGTVDHTLDRGAVSVNDWMPARRS